MHGMVFIRCTYTHGCYASCLCLNPMAELRVNINVASGYNAYLLELWAIRTKRPLSNLAAQLLEEGLNNALRDRRIPAAILEEVDKEFAGTKVCEVSLDEYFEEGIKGDSYRKIYLKRIEDAVKRDCKRFEEEAQKMDMDELKKLCDELPGI